MSETSGLFTRVSPPTVPPSAPTAAAPGSPSGALTSEEIAARPDDGLALAGSDSAALVGEYRWIEDALYRMLGQWVVDMPLAAVKVHLDAQSMRHAWHADLWADRLPVRDGVDPDTLTVPSPPSALLVATLAGAAARPGDVRPDSVPPGTETGPDLELPGGEEFDHPGALPRLAGLYRVALPRLVTSYERHLQAVVPVTDAPVARALRLVLNDEIEDWRAGERLVQRLVTRPHDVAAVHDFLRHLESTVVAAGAVSGLIALPGAMSAD